MFIFIVQLSHILVNYVKCLKRHPKRLNDRKGQGYSYKIKTKQDEMQNTMLLHVQLAGLSVSQGEG